MRSGRPTLRLFSPLALVLSPLALVLVTALQFGCYKPNIEDGGLLCNLDAGAKMCPEGYRCEMQSRRCYKNPDGAVDRSTCDRVDVPDMGTAADGERPAICFDARPGCTPGSGHVRSVLPDGVQRLPGEVLGEHDRRADLQRARSGAAPNAMDAALPNRVGEHGRSDRQLRARSGLPRRRMQRRQRRPLLSVLPESTATAPTRRCSEDVGGLQSVRRAIRR